MNAPESITQRQSNGMDRKIAALETRLKRLKRLAKLRQKVDRASLCLADWEANPSMKVILEATSTGFGVRPEDILSWTRFSHIADARMAFYFFLRKFTALSFEALGRSIGRNHTSLIHGCQRVEKLLATDRQFVAKFLPAERQILRQLEVKGSPNRRAGRIGVRTSKL